jgi:hypothetical protein
MVPLVVTLISMLVVGGGGFAVWKSGAVDKVMATFSGGNAEKRRPATAEEMRRELAAKTSPNPAPAAATPAGWNAAGPPPTNMPTSPPAATAAKTTPAANPTTSAAPPVPSGPDNIFGTISFAHDDKQGKGIRYLEVNVSDKIRWVGYRIAGGQPGLELSDLKELKGKNATITGRLESDPTRGSILFIRSRGDIVVQP